MNVADSILNFLKRKETLPNNAAAEGFCPNCWGRTEYEGQFFEALKNENIDINSPNPNVGWIQDYADKHLAGIKLKNEGDNQVCSKCKVVYRADHSVH